MKLKFVLDFDGVLFNSAFEAYTVCNKTVAGKPGFRRDVGFEEFLVFRSVVTDAWQYNRLYSERMGIEPAALPLARPAEADWAFATEFFEARKRIMASGDWAKVMPAYDFFFLLRPLMLAHPDRFAILSTRNVASIRAAMAYHDADVVPVFGQEDIRHHGSKLAVAKSQGWLAPGAWFIVYVDDMNRHLEPFEGQIHLPLHANWGYDAENDGSFNFKQVFNIISSLIAISE